MPPTHDILRPATRVIKLGGSLLDWGAWPVALRNWRQRQPPMRDVLIVGGGAWADLVRVADARFALGEEASHWLCLRLMGMTARLACHLLPEATLLDDWRALDSNRPAGSLVMADMLPLIEQAERADEGCALPHSWDVTSDSIAAWMALRLNAQELVLLKSQLPPDDAGLLGLAECEYADRRFPQEALNVPVVRCVNVRDPDLKEVIVPRSPGCAG